MKAAENRTPVRVALVTGKWNGYGVETLLLELARHIDPLQVEITFLVDGDSKVIPETEIRSTGASLVRIPPYQKPILYHRRLVQILRTSNFDIVHAHISTLSVFPLWAAWSAQAPIRISHVHTMSSTAELKKSALKYLLRPFAKRFSTHYAASSWKAAKWMFGDKAVSRNRVYFLPVARNLDAFRFDPKTRSAKRAELGLDQELVVGHLGRFVPQKNHLFLIKVFHEVLKLNPRAVLILAGDGPLVADVLAEAEKLCPNGSVRYLGLRSDAPSLYQAMDVFVLPSLYEGVPGTGVEAQAAGLPFIYSDCITDEIQLLPSAVRMPLESGPRRWAEVVLEAAQRQRTDELGLVSAAGYGSKDAARQLTDYYNGLVGREVESTQASTL